MNSILDHSKVLVLIFFVAFVGACAEEVKTEEDYRPSHEIYIQVNADGADAGVNAEVRVNDIPVREGIFTGSLSQISVRFCLLSGENTVSIMPYSTTGSVTVEMTRYPIFPNGRIDRGGEELLLSIKSEGGERVTGTINLPSERPSWSWLKADFVDNDASREEAITFSKVYYTAYVEADADILVPAKMPIFEDFDRQSPAFDIDSRSEGFGIKMKSFLGRDDWVFDDLDGIEFDVVPVANGKLFSVRREDGSALFRTNQEDPFDRIEGYTIIGRKDGKWAFYR